MDKQATAKAQPLSETRLQSLQTMANRLRKHSLLSTSAAGSGHPSSCFSCAELVAAVFFQFLRFDIQNPDHPLNDRFILSKGHAAPVLWAVLAEAGAFPIEKLQTLRQIDSDLEGHPTPRNPWVDVATGSLGQGLSIGVGMALASKLDQRNNRVFVLLGDGEAAEGAVWEAAALASHYRLDNLIAILDINRLGQSEPTMYGHNVDSYARRLQAFGWRTHVIDGHDLEEILAALEEATSPQGEPVAVIARTLKGKGVSFMENQDGWHGKPVTDPEQIQQALREIGEELSLAEPLTVQPPDGRLAEPPMPSRMDPPQYDGKSKVATRQAYGTALKKLGAADPRVVALDGDTKNSTYSLKFRDAFSDRFFECYIAEQTMVAAAVGLGALGKIPFASTFACFLTRAFDFIRMAGISQANLKLCGSHAGVSIGEDGPSQMGLEDLAMMRAIPGSTVLYPSDAVSTERLVELASQTPGIVYLRTTRPATPILYSNQEEFKVGGCKVVRSSDQDRATVIAAGITLHEALQAAEELQQEGIRVRVIDLYSVKPLDRETLQRAVSETGALVTVEDHYPEGGLGEAVYSALAELHFKFRQLAVRGLPRSGPSGALMDQHGISARHIVKAVKEVV